MRSRHPRKLASLRSAHAQHPLYVRQQLDQKLLSHCTYRWKHDHVNCLLATGPKASGIRNVGDLITGTSSVSKVGIQQRPAE